MNDEPEANCAPRRFRSNEDADPAAHERAERQGGNFLNRMIRRLRPGQPVPTSTASGCLMADGSLLNLNALEPLERLAYGRTGEVPKKFGKKASPRQVKAHMEAKRQAAREADEQRVHPRPRY